MMALANEVCAKYRLIADYAQRPYMNKLFSGRSLDFTEAKLPEQEVFLNSEYFPTFLGYLFVGFFISTNSASVLNGQVSLGTFLATISVFKEVGDAFTEIYASFVDLTKCFEPLGALTILFNKKTDLLSFKNLNRCSRAKTRETRAELFAEQLQNRKQNVVGGSRHSLPIGSLTSTSHLCKPTRFITDLIEISLNKVSFRYRDDSPFVLEDVSVSAPQGQVIAVTGMHGTGRATLLKIIGKVVFTTSGDVAIPTHLRVVHVTTEPILMRMGIWENLTFGLTKPCDDQDDRVLEVAKAMRLSQSILALMQSQKHPQEDRPPDDHWHETLTSTERAKIHLARGFVMNPEVLVLQRPLANFNTEEGKRMLSVFEEFAENKGICMPLQGRDDMRPRTLFFVPEDQSQAQRASAVWSLKPLNPDQPTGPQTVEVSDGASEAT